MIQKKYTFLFEWTNYISVTYLYTYFIIFILILDLIQYYIHTFFLGTKNGICYIHTVIKNIWKILCCYTYICLYVCVYIHIHKLLIILTLRHIVRCNCNRPVNKAMLYNFTEALLNRQEHSFEFKTTSFR